VGGLTVEHRSLLFAVLALDASGASHASASAYSGASQVSASISSGVYAAAASAPELTEAATRSVAETPLAEACDAYPCAVWVASP
jgi:hypothetical protein